MTANELRIGNWVHESYGGEYLIHLIHPNYVHLIKPFSSVAGEYDYDCIKPAPLTEEWLLKFGFEKSKHKDLYPNLLVYNIGEFTDIDYHKFSIEFSEEWKGWQLFETESNAGCNAISFIPIKYAHQLQNLIFALTGEELSVKEKAPHIK